MDLLPLVQKELGKALISKAKCELNETEEKAVHCLEKLKKLIEKESVACPKDDEFLIMFLRSKKYEVSKSFQQLKLYSYYRCRQELSFGYPDIEKIKNVLASTVCGLLPKRDTEGRVIMYFRASHYAPITYDYDEKDVMRTVQFLTHYLIQFPATQICGINFLADGSIPSVQIAQFIFKYMRTYAPKMHAFPARFKRIDCMNCNILFRACYTILKPMLPSKLLRRTTFLADEKEALVKIYPPSILPEEFGGTLGPIKDLTKDWIKDFEEYLPKYQASNIFFEKNNET